MTCRHTGADLYLESHGAVAHCDIHSIGNVAVCRISNLEHGTTYDPRLHYYVRNWPSAQWHDQRSDHSTLIVLQSSLIVPDGDRDRWARPD